MNTNAIHRRILGAIVPAVLLLAGTACGSDDNSTSAAGASSTTGGTDTAATKPRCVSGSISGAGSTFVQTIVQQWVKDYTAACPGATINYQGVGSGAGIQQFTAGTVDFGASDVVMKPEEEEAAAVSKAGAVLHIPWTSGAIAVMFHVSGVSSLKLTPETLAGIFAGTITKWNDPKLAADNPGLPNKPIQVVHRSDASGTTGVFTGYLSASAPGVWTAGAGKDVAWPVGTGAKGSDGVSASVKQTDGAIGYAELSFAKGTGVDVAKLKNEAGSFVEPSNAGVAAALTGSEVPADLKIKVSYSPEGTAAYPLSTVSWVIVPAKPKDATKAALLSAFVTYALSGGQKAAPNLFYAPLPASITGPAVTAAGTLGR